MGSTHVLFLQKQLLKCGYFTFDLVQKATKAGEPSPVGMLERPQNRARKREQSFTLWPSCTRRSSCCKSEGKAMVPGWGMGDAENESNLNHAAKLNPEVLARAHCVGRLESKMRCRLSHGQHLQIQEGETVCGSEQSLFPG